jgi:hypothetical protein
MTLPSVFGLTFCKRAQSPEKMQTWLQYQQKQEHKEDIVLNSLPKSLRQALQCETVSVMDMSIVDVVHQFVCDMAKKNGYQSKISRSPISYGKQMFTVFYCITWQGFAKLKPEPHLVI